MNTRIKELLEKYWEGESSLEEEKELRSLILASQDFPKEKELFMALGQFSSLEPKSLSIPKAKIHRLGTPWIRWAASVALLIGAFWGVTTYQQRQAEKKAYEEVLVALALIQTNLAKGQQQLQPLNDLKYLNTTNQLFLLNQTATQ